MRRITHEAARSQTACPAAAQGPEGQPKPGAVESIGHYRSLVGLWPAGVTDGAHNFCLDDSPSTSFLPNPTIARGNQCGLSFCDSTRALVLDQLKNPGG